MPSGYLLARSRGVNIRAQGSGNIGATNVWRVMGRRWGLLCFVLDVMKGLLPSVVAGVVISRASAGPGAVSADYASGLWLMVAVSAVLGHVFTPWLGFKGGKGVATAFGALVGVYPVFTLAALIALVCWGVALKLWRMVGLASVIAAVVLAGVVVAVHLLTRWNVQAVTLPLEGLPGYAPATLLHAGFAVGLASLVVFKHRGNLARTLAGTEPKIGQRTPTPGTSAVAPSPPTPPAASVPGPGTASVSDRLTPRG